MRLEAEHVGGHVGHGLLDRRLLLGPGRPADLGELGGELRAADVLLDQLDRRGRHVDLRALGKLELQKLLGAAVLLEELEPTVAADAVGDVDDVVALVEIEEGVDRPGEPLPGRPGRDLLAVEKLGAADQHELLGHHPKPAREPAAGEVEPLGAGRGRARRAVRPAAVSSASIGQTTHTS